MVGTARLRRGWPPKEYKEIDNPRFNTVYQMNDDLNFRIFRWIDNNQVTMVSTVHNGNEFPRLRQRRKPRTTATNRSHVQQVWGNNGVAKINIPSFIDDYNYWMGGV